MFKEERENSQFDWSMIGNIEEGRPNLGSEMNVTVYRLMQFTLRDVIIREFDVATADMLFFQAGEEAGRGFYQALLGQNLSFDAFIKELQDLLIELKVGILRVERADLGNMNLTLTVSEDLDCSGLPVCNEEICIYDEGFIKGLLSAYTGHDFEVKEVDCWCSGGRVCRFEVKRVLDG